jgi:hypothetical protein
MAALTVEEMVSQGKRAVFVLEHLLHVHVPKTLKDALNEDWLAIAQDGGEGFLQSIPEKELRAWGRRTITMERANGLLRTFEESLVESYVKRPENPLSRVFGRFLAMPKFIGNNLVVLGTVVLPLILKFAQETFRLGTNQVNVDRLKAVLASGMQNGVPINPGQRFAMEQDLAGTEHEIDLAIGEITKIWVSVAAVCAFYAVEDIITLCGTAAALSHSLRPVTLSRDLLCEAVKKSALPQRNGKRYRSRKRAR